MSLLTTLMHFENLIHRSILFNMLINRSIIHYTNFQDFDSLQCDIWYQ